jgi:predicted CoA-substrate-specific enzyme activase
MVAVSPELFLGIDVGSTTVKVVVLDADRTLHAHTYLRSNGRPRQTLLGAVETLLAPFEAPRVVAVGLTGSGGGPIAALIGARHVNELIAQTRAVTAFHPEARTVIELGGQDSKLLLLDRDPKTGEVVLADFAMNALCAAGTGSFLDQQAERLGIAIEKEFAEIALQSAYPARIAGRCTVFAKSDMIHLQQQGTPLPDILAGLCLALARNFRAVIGKGKVFRPPVLFQGGVAYNRAVVRAFEQVLELEPGQLIVPEHHCLMAALGTAYHVMDEYERGEAPAFHGFGPLADVVRAGDAAESMPPLSPPAAPARPAAPHAADPAAANGRRIPTALGIDVGSISTCLVLIDEANHVLARRYLLTAGRPLEAVRQGLLELGGEAADRFEVVAVGATGSGRYLTGDFAGADAVRNEITAQARAAAAHDPEVDTVFEIGGQDSKFIRLDNGAVVDFTMNHACAAGTGSFLEEQAERLKISIQRDFSPLALSSPCPVSLGERCTVFMESDLVHHQQQGRTVPDLTGGLAYSIAQNYLNRVVEARTPGKRIFFQGGVAWNESVVAAFEGLLGRSITVPPHHDVTGAIGAAILAREAMARERERANGGPPVTTRFKGFDLVDRAYETSTFECRACPNLCTVSRVVIGKDPPIFYGARCDKFEEAGRGEKHPGAGLPDLFAERSALLLGPYAAPVERANGSRNGSRRRVGIPRSLVFYDLFPYWRTFFETLDLEVVLSDATTPQTIRAAQEQAVAETCFPVKLVYGHVADLFEKQVDFVFLPSVINRENAAPGQPNNQYCPYIPAVSHLVTANVDFAARGVRPLKVALEMSWATGRHTQLQALAPELGVSKRRIRRAVQAAEEAQGEFYAAVRRRGREVLAGLEPGRLAAVIVGRPYNTHDRGASLDIPFKLRRQGVLAIPMDFLPLETVDVSARYPNMFWRGGQDILAAATLIAGDPRLQAVYVTNFSCGPDSFISGFFRRIMGRKPYLELEIDDHTADAGVVTRCEAFFDSLR